MSVTFGGGGVGPTVELGELNLTGGAKGSLVTFDATPDEAILAVGTDTHVLTADSAAANGIKWAAVPAGAAEDLATTLSAGNTTGATDIVITSGQSLEYAGTFAYTLDRTDPGQATTITMPDPGSATDTMALLAATQTFTTKTIALGSNTVSGTMAQFNTACTDGTFAYTADTLAVFAATTSAQLAGVISDETGSGALVFATSPTLTTPTLTNPSIGNFINANHDHSGVTSGGTISHGDLDDVGVDDHSQYALLAGRSGGQVLVGGTVANNDLTLRATSSATDGDIIFETDPTTEGFRINSSQQALAQDGTEALPSYSFSNSDTTGFYRAAANVIGVSIAGDHKGAWASNGNFLVNNVDKITAERASDTAIEIINEGGPQPHLYIEQYGNTQGPIITYRRNRGTFSTALAVNSGDDLGIFQFQARAPSGIANSAVFKAQADAAPSGMNADGRLTFSVYGGGTLYEVVRASGANQEFVVNDSAADIDFRCESDNGTNLIHADASPGTGAGGLGFHGSTPVVQHTSTGQTAGFTAGAGTSVLDDSTFTGGVGTAAYTIGDVVKALKEVGLMASS